MRRRALLPLILALGLAVPACGGDDEGEPIPSSAARQMLDRLEEVERRSDPLRCGDLRQDSLPVLERQVGDLPERVDPDVRDALEDGIRRLGELVDEDCEEERRRRERQREEEESQTDTETTPLPEPEPEPPKTETEEEPPPPDTEEEPPPDEEPPGNNGGQPGNGNGGNQGGGQGAE